MISATSRYASSQVVSVINDGQLRQVIVPSQAVAYTFSYISHQWTDNDRLDLLANTYFGDATQWYQIADANPEIINWATVAAGTVVRVPYT